MAKLRGLVWVGFVCALACQKKESPPPAEKPSESAQPQVGPPPVQKPARAQLTITSKSPEAIAAFKKGRELADQVRFAEAVEEYKKAIQLDPDFALAHAMLGGLTPGPEGEALLQKAQSLAGALPEAERTVIEAALAGRQGDDAKAAQLMQKVAELAPGEWRVHFQLGMRATNARKFDDAIAEFRKASEANPEAAAVHNGLAYAYAAQRKYDDAIAAAKKQTELLASEPNPQDTYGEILMMAGKFPEAEAAFQKAIELSPKFALAWQGVAFTRFYRKDWAGGYAALASGKQAATLPQDRTIFDFDQAWAKFAEGKPADAMKQLDTLDKSDEVKQVPQLAIQVSEARAAMSYLLGKYPDASKYAAQMQERTDKAKLPGAVQKESLRSRLLLTLAVQAKQGKAADADKTAAELEAAAKDAPPGFAGQLVTAHGLLKLAKGDPKGAAAEMAACWQDDFICLYERSLIEEKAGDKSAAAATKKDLHTKYFRADPFLWIAGRP
jgi:tetratricopeptide (TPR) repeat protein